MARSIGRIDEHNGASSLRYQLTQYSVHCSQGFNDRDIAHPDDAYARIIKVDRYPESDRKNGSVNGVEQRKPAASTAIAEAQNTNADCCRSQKRSHDRNGQMSPRHSEVRQMQIDDL